MQTWVDKFLSRCPIFRARFLTCVPDRARKKMGVQNQIGRSIDTQLETLLFALYNLIALTTFIFNVLTFSQ